MSSIQAFLFTTFMFGFNPFVVAQTASPDKDGVAKTQHENEWPPAWIEGAWKVESVETTCNGKPTERNFVTAQYVLFTSNHRFSLFKQQRLTAAPMIGQDKHRDTLHCLFKMTNNRPAMQTYFTQHTDHMEYVSYLVMPKDGRFRFKRRLTRVTNKSKFVDLLQTAANEVVFAPQSETAAGIIETWIEKHKPSAPKQ